ncbi:MAG: signal peptidase II [Alphaproteobacteria bacterium]|nr:signal peptidase II [Alphaproteobacteria bacterium]
MGLDIALVVFALDQVSKMVLIEFLNGLNFEPIRITGFFNIVMVWNRGVSFGLFGSGEEITRWLLTVFAFAVSIGLVFLMRKQTKTLPVVALGLVIGGALGNAVDRIVYGAVADFFDVHVAGWNWPAFNIADSAITVGVIILVVDALLTPKSTPKVTP